MHISTNKLRQEPSMLRRAEYDTQQSGLQENTGLLLMPEATPLSPPLEVVPAVRPADHDIAAWCVAVKQNKKDRLDTVERFIASGNHRPPKPASPAFDGCIKVLGAAALFLFGVFGGLIQHGRKGSIYNYSLTLNKLSEVEYRAGECGKNDDNFQEICRMFESLLAYFEQVKTDSNSFLYKNKIYDDDVSDMLVRVPATEFLQANVDTDWQRIGATVLAACLCLTFIVLAQRKLNALEAR
jgi:hypothetical protein